MQITNNNNIPESMPFSTLNSNEITGQKLSQREKESLSDPQLLSMVTDYDEDALSHEKVIERVMEELTNDYSNINNENATENKTEPEKVLDQLQKKADIDDNSMIEEEYYYSEPTEIINVHSEHPIKPSLKIQEIHENNIIDLKTNEDNFDSLEESARKLADKPNDKSNNVLQTQLFNEYVYYEEEDFEEDFNEEEIIENDTSIRKNINNTEKEIVELFEIDDSDDSEKKSQSSTLKINPFQKKTIQNLANNPESMHENSHQSILEIMSTMKGNLEDEEESLLDENIKGNNGDDNFFSVDSWNR